MKFRVGDHVSVNGTHLQGYVTTTYAHLVHVLGKPTYTDGDKVTCEWTIQFRDGTIATIYDWKTECTPHELYDWHVGGNDPRAVLLVGLVLDSVVRYGW